MHGFHLHVSKIEYVEDQYNTCVFSSMAYDLFDANEPFAEHTILSLIPSSLSCYTVG